MPGGGAGAPGGAGQGGAGGQAPQQVTITFRAAVGTQPFACGQTYTNQGTAGTSVTPRDFRFYVQDLRLINAAGQEVPVMLNVRDPWQSATVALLDFENGQASCLDGDAGTNTTITGTLPAGQYTGVAFRNGVPMDLNHDDPTTLPAPLRAPRMQWSWLTGFRFVKANSCRPAARPSRPPKPVPRAAAETRARVRWPARARTAATSY